MAYADQQMSGNRIIAIIIVALIHIALGYLLITGLAIDAVKNVVERVTTVDVEEEPPPEPEPEEELPPPPPENVPDFIPPPVVPPAPVDLTRTVAPSRTISEPVFRPPTPQPTTKQCPNGVTVGANQACPEPTKTCPTGVTVRVSQACPEPSRARDLSPDNQARWSAQIDRDYPPSAQRREEEGTVTMRITVGTNGRVADCAVTGSSGSSALDQAACKGMRRYARYNPALNDAGNPVTATTSQSIRYVLPE